MSALRVFKCAAFVAALTCSLAALLDAQPSIQPNGIVNASGYQALLAPDAVFTIFGSSLGPAQLQAASAPNYPPLLAGTAISFTPSSGGAPIAANIVYTLATQVAGILASSI